MRRAPFYPRQPHLHRQREHTQIIYPQQRRNSLKTNGLGFTHGPASSRLIHRGERAQCAVSKDPRSNSPNESVQQQQQQQQRGCLSIVYIHEIKRPCTQNRRVGSYGSLCVYLTWRRDIWCWMRRSSPPTRRNWNRSKNRRKSARRSDSFRSDHSGCLTCATQQQTQKRRRTMLLNGLSSSGIRRR